MTVHLLRLPLDDDDDDDDDEEIFCWAIRAASFLNLFRMLEFRSDRRSSAALRLSVIFFAFLRVWHA